MGHVVIVGALPESLVNFRGDLIRSIISQGHKVTAMAASGTSACVLGIEALGATFIPYPVNRAGRSVVQDLRTFRALQTAFAKLQPDVVLAYTVKPVIWAGFAARAARVSQFFALIEGLGYAFQTGHLRRRLVGMITGALYFMALRRAVRVIFLNPDNRRAFLSKRLIRETQAEEIDGIGVDLNSFANTPVPAGPPKFLCIARLLGDKGLREYAEAARRVRTHYPDARIMLVGPADSSPDCIPIEEVRSWHNRGILEYLGEALDVRPLLAKCSVYVLPSYHEGMPRTILEAMAMGRPIITTDVPGCRQTVTPGENGYLVPKMDIDALVERMIWFLEHSERCQTMGASSRRMAEERFDVVKINAKLLGILNLHVLGRTIETAV
jgi:glycosyltransferase involved in cell wall biosynthesis